MQKPGETGSKIDITNSVSTASLSIDQDRISVLDITIDRQVSAFIEFVTVGFVIHFYGGFTDNNNYYTQSDSVDKRFNTENFSHKTDDSEHFKYLFKGSVHAIKTNYSEDGTKTMSLTCKDFSWGAVASTPNFIAYPSKDCSRKFADTTTIKLSDIIKGICDETGMSLGQFDVATDFEYTTKNPAVQNDQSDWSFLRELATDHKCYVWTELIGNEYKLNFVQSSKARGTSSSSLEFIWLDRTDDFMFADLKQLPDGDSVSELTKLADNQVKINTVDLTVNQQLAAGQVVNKVTDFDVDGTKKEVLVSYDETADEIIYYELNQAKVDALVRNNPDEADRISNMGPTGIPKDVWLEYYTPVSISKEKLKAMDMPLFGIEMTASVIGNLNIHPFQSYPVYGMGKWSTRPNGRLKYYVTGLTHTWGPGDFTSEIHFKA